MTDLFITFLNMSITGVYVILAVLLVRFFLKGMPKKYSYLLWSVVGFRLCCPFSFKSVVSLFNLKPFDMSRAQSVSGTSLDYVRPATENISVGIPAMNTVIAETTSTPVYKENVNWLLVAVTAIWIVGIIAFVIYSLVSFIKLNKALSTAIKVDNRIFKSDKINSPFIIGIIKPKIYIPSDVDDEYMEYIIAHEKHHIKRFDNGIKLISFVLLALHWFNPLCWIAFYLMTKDMEMSCDEYVLAKNNGIKKAYSSALLSFATEKSFPAPSPVFFSESGVKTRIKNVLKYKKPRKIVSAIAIILSLALLVACAANPSQTIQKGDFDDVAVFKFKDNSYIVGNIIGMNPYSSVVGYGPELYANVDITENEIEIYFNPSFDNYEKRRQLKLSRSYQTDLEIDNDYFVHIMSNEDAYPEMMIRENYLYMFENANKIMVDAYKNDTESYLVYSLNGVPFAFQDDLSIYRLESYNFNNEVTRAIRNNVDKGEYLAESHEIISTYDGDEKGRSRDKYLTVYAYATLVSFDYDGFRIKDITSKQNAAVEIVLNKNNGKLSFKKLIWLSKGSDEKLPDFIKEDVKYLDTERNILEMQIKAFDTAIGRYELNYESIISNAFTMLHALPLDEVKENQNYDVLRYFDNLTLDYICYKFNTTEADEHMASIYKIVFEDIIKQEDRDIRVNINFDGKQYYDAVYDYYLNRLKELGPDDMKFVYPKGYRILDSNGNTSQYINAYANWKVKFENEKATAYDTTPQKLQFRWCDQRGRKIEKANLVVAVNDKAVIYEPINIVAIDQDGSAWDYIGETKTSYTFDANEDDKIEVLGEFVDNFGMNYRVYLTPTEQNSSDDQSANIVATFIGGNMGG